MAARFNIDLSRHHVQGSKEAYYIPQFVTEDEETYLIRKLIEAPQHKWKTLPNRRLQVWGGELTAKSVLIPQEIPPFFNSFPDLIGRIRATGAFQGSPHGAPNHVIVNEYLPGQGIMPHEDGPSYHPVVATLSLGSHAVFHYYQYEPDIDASFQNLGEGHTIDTNPVLSVLLEPRSLIITTSSLYSSHLHGIDGIEEDMFFPSDEAARIANADLLVGEAERHAVICGGTLKRSVRYSLTCRDVGRVFRRMPIGKS